MRQTPLPSSAHTTLAARQQDPSAKPRSGYTLDGREARWREEPTRANSEVHLQTSDWMTEFSQIRTQQDLVRRSARSFRATPSKMSPPSKAASAMATMTTRANSFPLSSLMSHPIACAKFLTASWILWCSSGACSNGFTIVWSFRLPRPTGMKRDHCRSLKDTLKSRAMRERWLNSPWVISYHTTSALQRLICEFGWRPPPHQPLRVIHGLEFMLRAAALITVDELAVLGLPKTEQLLSRLLWVC